MNKKIDSFVIHKDADIKEAMQCIDKSGNGIALVVDKQNKLYGVVTDGDIRRALLAGKSLETAVETIMVTTPIVAPCDTSAVELLEIMLERGIHQIPVVDKDNILLDVALLRELKSIPLSSPDITHKEIDIINQVLSTPLLSIGPKIKQFEDNISQYINTKFAVGVNSGTSALHLCIKSLDIKDGDEVITSPFSFIASANCVLYERAKPVFVDIDKDTLCIDAEKIEEKITPKTKAILPVHIFGHPCKMDKIMGIAKKYNLAVIEDACEAIGSEYKGKKVGTFGNVGVFAFYPNKQITTAEGGMIVTDDEKIMALCRSMRNQGRDDGESWLSHQRLGYNYRMSELSAALGVVQMERIDEILKKRQKIAEVYNKNLERVKGIKIPYVGDDIKMSWFVYVIRLSSDRFPAGSRDRVMQNLKDKGISCNRYFPPIHLAPFYVNKFGYKRGDYPITENVSEVTIALPFYNNLTETQVCYICESLKKIIASL